MKRLLVTSAVAAATIAGLQAAKAQQGSDNVRLGYTESYTDRVLREIEEARSRGECKKAEELADEMRHFLNSDPADYWNSDYYGPYGDTSYLDDRLGELQRRPCPPSAKPSPPPPEPIESVLDDLTPVVPLIGLGEMPSSRRADPTEKAPALERVENVREELEEGRRREAERRRKAREQLKPDEQTLLDLHNRARSSVGVPPLDWDSQLASQAASYGPELARTGRLAHSSRKGRETSRENLLQALPGTSAEKMIAVWTTERQHFVPGIFPDVSRTGNWADVGHYTQIVWPTTTRVGCAIHRGSGQFDWLICRYAPPGNQDGKPILLNAPPAPRQQ